MEAKLPNIKKFLELVDEQYVFYNLPADITRQELERMLYHKGQLSLKDLGIAANGGNE